MKTDLYTKSILTIIAVCLVLIVLKDIDIFPKAYASQPNTPNYGIVPLNEDGTIDVNVKNFDSENVLKVEMLDEINVNIEEVGGKNVRGGALRVVIGE
jgi:hypothetical protein